mmetsp:Transcript_29024/g.21599  ORF Transcript_29024/g.21599 Transcript_29024/m.21599 type:complete len:116 (+) Transcript_29024:881-1228(+)
MVMFGGIFEITKELNDFMLYDIAENKWITLFEESVSPKKLPREYHMMDDGSPGEKSPKKSNSPMGKTSNLRNKSNPKVSSKNTIPRNGSPVKKNLAITMNNHNSRNQKGSTTTVG